MTHSHESLGPGVSHFKENVKRRDNITRVERRSEEPQVDDKP